MVSVRVTATLTRERILQQPEGRPRALCVRKEAPRLNSTNDVRKAKSVGSDLQFEERLQAVKRSALQQKKTEEEKAYGAIDYDAPVEPRSTTIGLGTKIGVGAAVIVFGLVFALGDFLPSGRRCFSNLMLHWLHHQRILSPLKELL